MCHKRINKDGSHLLHFSDWMSQSACLIFVCLTFLYFLPEVIGRKITRGRGKFNKKVKCLKGDLYIE